MDYTRCRCKGSPTCDICDGIGFIWDSEPKATPQKDVIPTVVSTNTNLKSNEPIDLTQIEKDSKDWNNLIFSLHREPENISNGVRFEKLYKKLSGNFSLNKIARSYTKIKGLGSNDNNLNFGTILSFEEVEQLLKDL